MKTTEIKNLGLLLVIILMIFVRSMSAQTNFACMGGVAPGVTSCVGPGNFVMGQTNVMGVYPTMAACIADSCNTIVITPPCTLPGASVYSSPNGLMTIMVNGGTPPYTYLWSNGSGNPILPFYQNWCLQIIDANGCDTMICDTSLVTPCTLAGAYVTSSPNGLSAGVMTMPPNALVYVWSNGMTGNWSAFYQNWCVQIIDSVSGCDTMICDTSNLVPFCQADFTAMNIGFNPNAVPVVMQFNDWSLGNANNWFWDFGDGTTGTGQNPVHSYALPGLYNVCLTIDEVAPNGTLICQDTYCDIVFVDTTGINPPPFCQADFYFTQVGASDSTFFFNMSSGITSGTSYFWDFGDNSFSTDENPIHLYAQSGTYYVCLTIMDSTTNCYDTYCDYLTVVVAGGNGCQAYFWGSPGWTPNTYEFFDFSSGNVTNWLWSFGDGTTSTQQNPVHTYSSTGSGFYQVCLTIEEYDPITQALICTDTYCDSIYMLNQFSCQADFYAQNLGNNEATFTNTSYPQSGLMSTVDIDYGDGNIDYNISSSVNHTYASAGTYYVCVTVNSMDSSQTVTCTDTYCDSVTVTSGTMPCQADFCSFQDSSIVITQNPNGTTTNTMSDVFYFCDLSTPVNMIQSWQWDMGDNGAGQYLQNTFSTSQAPVYEFDTTGVYNVCLTIVTIGGQCTSTTCDSVDFSMMQGGPISAIEEINAFQELKLYPNPASDRVTVNLISNTIGDLSIRLVNMMGQTLSNSTITIFNGAINHSLDVSEIANGVYSVEVVLNGKKQHQRVVISR